MAAPTNISFATAIEIGGLPYTTTQQVDDLGTFYTVYYKYTAQPGDRFLSITIMEDGLVGNYQPNLYISTDGTGVNPPNPPPGAHVITNANGSSLEQCHVLVGVVPGGVYYFVIIEDPSGGSSSPAVIYLHVESAPPNQPTLPEGSLFIPAEFGTQDLTQLWGVTAATMMDKDDGSIIGFLKTTQEFPSGEMGDILPDGEILHWQILNLGPIFRYQLFQYDGVDSIDHVSDTPLPFSTVGGWAVGTLTWFDPVRSQPQLDYFNAGFMGYHLTNRPSEFIKISKTGVPIGVGGSTTPWVMPAGSEIMSACSVLNDDQTLLYGTNGGIEITQPSRRLNSTLYRYDLVADAPMSDFAADVSGYGITDILVFADDTILVAYWYNDNTTPPKDFFIRLYDSGGSIIRTYTFPSYTGLSVITPRLAWGVDQTTFWAWIHLVAGIGSAVNIRVSDGAVLQQFSYPTRGGGILSNPIISIPDYLTDYYKYAPSESCPLIILRTAASGPVTPPITPPITPPTPGVPPIGSNPFCPNSCAIIPLFTNDVGLPVAFVCA